MFSSLPRVKRDGQVPVLATQEADSSSSSGVCSYLYELEQEIVTLRRELASRGGGSSAGVAPVAGPSDAGQQPGPVSLQPQYYQQQSQEADGQHYQQTYAPDDLPQGSIVHSPPYGNFYSAPADTKPDLQHSHSGYQPMMIDPSLQQNGYGHQGGGYSHARQSSSTGSMTPGGAEGSSHSSGVPGRDVNSLLNGVGFAGHESGEPRFMGSSSGSELTDSHFGFPCTH